MPRIFKGSESELRLLLSRSQETLTDIKIKLYTTNLEDAIEVIDGIAVEGDIAIISLAPRAFIGMEDGVVNYIVEAKVEGQSYYMERQSNYMLRSLSYINESGVASSTLEITQNGDYRVTPNDGLYVDIDVNVPVPVILDKDTLTLKSGDSGVYTPPQTYDGVKTLEYDVLPNQNIEVTITDNGEYTYNADTEYSGIGVFKANVEVPIQEKAEVFNDNGDYTIVPDENYVAMRRINVKVDYKPRPVIPNGISLKGSTFTTLDMGQQDWSKVYDCHYMFSECKNLERIENFPLDMEMLICTRLFYNCTKLITGPMMNFSKVTDISYLFDGCSGLTSVELSDTSNITNMSGLFRDCASLTAVPQFDTSNVTTMSQMFCDCASLTAVPQFDTSNVTKMDYLFENCSSLTSVPMMDTSKVKDMYYIFRGCKSLTTIPPLDTSNVTTMEEAFYGCSGLTSVPQLNTSKVKKMNNLFRGCSNLISVGGIDTSSATTMSYMFNGCSKLQEVRFTGNPINLTNVSSMTLGCSQTGTLYYPAEYADAYQIIINAFPSNWVKVAE